MTSLLPRAAASPLVVKTSWAASTRPGRCVMFSLALLLVGAGVASAATLPLWQAQIRSPQAPVNGTGLRDYLVSVGESIDPGHDQVVVDLFTGAVSNNSTFTVQIELCTRQDSASIGFFNGHDVAPVPMNIFPPEAKAGWFAVFSYRTAPIRGVVQLFDENAAFRGSRTYFGADRHAVGIYFSGPGGSGYSQDARNPEGETRVLFYRGTGINAGSAWIAMETGSNADNDFDDDVLFIEAVFNSLTPVRHTNWAELKARFR